MRFTILDNFNLAFSKILHVFGNMIFWASLSIFIYSDQSDFRKLKIAKITVVGMFI